MAAPGSIVGYPPQAIIDLTWDRFYINFYAAVIGLLAVVIGLTAFRCGEKWAWFSILVFVLVGVVTNIFDYVSWGRLVHRIFCIFACALGFAPLCQELLVRRD